MCILILRFRNYLKYFELAVFSPSYSNLEKCFIILKDFIIIIIINTNNSLIFFSVLVILVLQLCLFYFNQFPGNIS